MVFFFFWNHTLLKSNIGLIFTYDLPFLYISIHKNICFSYTQYWGFSGGSDGKESACNAGDPGLIPGLGRSPKEGMTTYSSILAWRIHKQRSLVGYSPWGHKESDTTEWLTHFVLKFTTLRDSLFLYGFHYITLLIFNLGFKWSLHQTPPVLFFRWRVIFVHCHLVAQLCPTLWWHYGL